MVQGIETDANPLRAAKDAALAMTVEHEELLVREVEIAPGAVEEPGKVGTDRSVRGKRPRFGQRFDERADRPRKLGARVRGVDCPAANDDRRAQAALGAYHGAGIIEVTAPF